MSDSLKQLFDILKEANVRVTFSRHCCSGLIGADKCECWRCRKARGLPPDEALAERVTKAAKGEFNRSLGIDVAAPKAPEGR